MSTFITKSIVVCIALAACVGLVGGMTMYLNDHTNVVAEEKQDFFDDIPPHVTSDFEKGDYYFNNDEDPSGPYDIEKAKFFYERAIAEDPKVNNLVWYQLGRIYFIQGDFDMALESFAKQQEYFGDQIPNVYYMIGLTYGYRARQMGNVEDWQKGEDAFERFITFVPQAPWPRVDLAWLLFAQGKFEKMKPVLAQGLVYRPNNPWLLNMYGLAMLNTEDKETAFEYFAKAEKEVADLTVQDWGLAYPGNDPAVWKLGLEEFRKTIEKNISLASS